MLYGYYNLLDKGEALIVLILIFLENALRPLIHLSLDNKVS